MKNLLRSKPSEAEWKRKKFEELMLFLDKLKEKCEEGAIIIVEGWRDAEALKSLGVDGEFCCIKNTRIPICDLLIEYANINREIIVLTDFDRDGVKLAEKIRRYLESYGKTVNLNFWLKIGSLISKEVKDVEGLSSYFRNILEKN
ncbi:MAG: toprim domain-containing protein [Candidatus Bathyarchaeota archaeon]